MEITTFDTGIETLGSLGTIYMYHATPTTWVDTVFIIVRGLAITVFVMYVLFGKHGLIKKG